MKHKNIVLRLFSMALVGCLSFAPMAVYANPTDTEVEVDVGVVEELVIPEAAIHLATAEDILALAENFIFLFYLGEYLLMYLGVLCLELVAKAVGINEILLLRAKINYYIGLIGSFAKADGVSLSKFLMFYSKHIFSPILIVIKAYFSE